MREKIQVGGLWLGPVLAILVYGLLPETYVGAQQEVVVFSASGRATLAMMVLMATWWLTEAIDMSITALLPLTLFPVLGILPLDEAAKPYADPLIFLYMGGFLLALSMQRWQLDRRIALQALACVGTRPSQIVGGFMAVTAGMSAFVSNTATTAMMLPIALSILRLTHPESAREEHQGVASGTVPTPATEFGAALMLSIAYAASIGGIATIVGTPTNAVLVGYLYESAPAEYRMEIGFARWLLVGVPVALIYLPITWWLLTRVLHRLSPEPLLGGHELITRSLQELGPVRRGERVTLVLFVLAGLVWMVRPWLAKWSVTIDGQPWQPLGGLSDTSVALMAALTLFLIPVDLRSRTFVMDWETAERLPWGILLLFGGGFSLASAVSKNGVAEFIGSYAAQFSSMPDWVLVALVTTFVVFFTELTSNTATATTMVPLLVALGPGLKVHPYLLVFPATIAASCAFMLPVATPPNAMVFAGGYIQLSQMIRAGWWLNLLGIVLVVLVTFLIVKPVFVP